jgi:TPP-dependent pyruvate/acetoin dehydrogenase alpha subunit
VDPGSDPVVLLGARLLTAGACSRDDLREADRRAREAAERLTEAALDSPGPTAGDTYRYVFAEPSVE